MKKIFSQITISLLLTLLLSVTAFAATEGTVGGIDWDFDYSSHTLTLSGSGALEDFNNLDNRPWSLVLDDIQTIIIEEGVTSIGTQAFYGLENLERVTLPKSLDYIGLGAFMDCTSLTSLSLSEGLENIGESAFNGCTSLSAVYLPSTLESIGTKAFYLCTSLRTLTVPAGVTSLGTAAFANCTSLISVSVLGDVEELPMWAFYGCTSLTSITLAQPVDAVGDSAFTNCDSLNTVATATGQDSQVITDALAGVTASPSVSTSTTTSTSTSATGTTETVVDSQLVVTQTTVTETASATVVTQQDTVFKADEFAVEEETYTAQAVIRDQEGWSDVITQVETENQSVTVDVLLIGDTVITDETLSQLAGQDVTLNITTQSGTKISINAQNLGESAGDVSYDFNYNLERLYAFETDQRTLLGADGKGFTLTFQQDSTIPFTIYLDVGTEFFKQTATLYYFNDMGEWVSIESGLVDGSGIAEFHLADVQAETQYFLTVGGVIPADQEVLVPETLAEDYGLDIIGQEYVEYTVTGVEGIIVETPFGLSLLQLTVALIAGIVGCFVAVGVVMFRLNKRRLQLELEG